MDISIVNEVSTELVQAFEKLLPQLTSGFESLSREDLERMVKSESVVLIMAVQKNIVGTLTLTINRIPTGTKVWIEDVVVDDEMRGKGIGEKLVAFAIKYAKENGYKQINLTSSVKRIAAKKLYKKLGFTERDTTIFSYSLD